MLEDQVEIAKYYCDNLLSSYSRKVYIYLRICGQYGFLLCITMKLVNDSYWCIWFNGYLIVVVNGCSSYL